RRRGVARHAPAADPRPSTLSRTGGPRALTREERRLLRQGIARLAFDGRPAEAAAVALLDGTGASVGALAGLTARDIRTVAEADGTEHAIVTFHDTRGDVVALPVPLLARQLLRSLSRGRSAGEPLITRDDGRPADREWLGGALTDAALAGGIPERRAKLLHPYMLRATTVAELLEEWSRSPEASGARLPLPREAGRQGVG
ncbi:hypothetical protein ABZ297_46185, partial [Nonomuraea sp. NPDC005983]|uniref:hypothetical protein n=1 Tax=Nonomuraea sp. NPDC005983 TaxID=3155595 RepID=UPI0033B3E7FA